MVNLLRIFSVNFSSFTINPLKSANVRYTPHKGDVICSRCGASYHHNGLRVFERGVDSLQNGIFHFVFSFSQSSEIALES